MTWHVDYRNMLVDQIYLIIIVYLLLTKNLTLSGVGSLAKRFSKCKGSDIFQVPVKKKIISKVNLMLS